MIKEDVMESKLIKAINKEIGEPHGGILMFPPICFVAPLILLFDFADSFERISPCVCEALLDVATPDEQDKLRSVVCATRGRPRKRDIARLRRVLRRNAISRKENDALVRLEAKCR